MKDGVDETKGGETRVARGGNGKPSGEPTRARGRSRSSIPAATHLPAQLGSYRVRRRLGAGGMAEIYLAERTVDGAKETVVLKCVAPAFKNDEKFADMFLREAGVALRLDHPNIVKVFELIEEEEETALVMEYLDGYTVRDLAKTAWRCGRSLPLSVVAAIVQGACRGLAYAHELVDERGVPLELVHRDVAPDNLFVTRSGHVKLLDFGLAKPKEGEALTQAGEIKGKLRFMSPEQLKGKDTDARTDVFSLGVSTYWLLTGHRPFDGDSDVDVMQAILEKDPKSPRRLNPKIPPALDELVLQALAKDRARRTGSARAMEIMFERAVDADIAFPDEVADFLADIDGLEVPSDPKPPKYACVPVVREEPKQVETTSPRKKKSIDPSGPTRVVPSEDGEVFSAPAGDGTSKPKRRKREAALTAALTGVEVDSVMLDDAPSYDDMNKPNGDEGSSFRSGNRQAPPDTDHEETRTLGPAAAGKIKAALEAKHGIRLDDEADDDEAKPTNDHPRIAARVVSGPVVKTAVLTATERVTRRPPQPQQSGGSSVGAAITVVIAVVVLVVGTFSAMRFGWIEAGLARLRAVQPGVVVAPPGPDGLQADGPKTAGPTQDVPPSSVSPPSTTPPVELPGKPLLQAVQPTPTATPTTTPTATPGAGDERTKRPTSTPRAPAMKVRTDGPAYVKWSLPEGRSLGQGAGTFSVPEGTAGLVALDARRGVRATVPIKDGTADYGTLPKGELVVRARPWADVTLGIEALGQTPIQKVAVIAGTYKVELVWNDVKKTQMVKIAPGETKTVQVDMREP